VLLPLHVLLLLVRLRVWVLPVAASAAAAARAAVVAAAATPAAAAGKGGNARRALLRSRCLRADDRDGGVLRADVARAARGGREGQAGGSRPATREGGGPVG